jgi:hypothetical protein
LAGAVEKEKCGGDETETEMKVIPNSLQSDLEFDKNNY